MMVEDDCCDGLVFLVAKKMFNQKYLVELIIRKEEEMPHLFYSYCLLRTFI